MLAYSWPLLSLFWTFLEFAAVFLFVFFILWCFVDNFRRRDHHGAAKAIWTVVILFIPVIGAIVYVAAAAFRRAADELSDRSLRPGSRSSHLRERTGFGAGQPGRRTDAQVSLRIFACGASSLS